MIVSETKGDILRSPYKNIAHGVNCKDKMGSGVAKALFTKYPEVKTSYHEFCSGVPELSRLGEVQPVDCGEVIVFNCFTQFNYGYDNKKYVSYEAIVKCFKTLNMYLKGQSIAIPRIGCGLAGGDWTVVRALIDELTPDLDVYVYYL